MLPRQALDANERLQDHVDKNTMFYEGDAQAEKAVPKVCSSL